MFPEFGGDSSAQTDNFMTKRASGLATYRNTDFFGVIDGLNLTLQYQGKNENRDVKNSHPGGIAIIHRVNLLLQQTERHGETVNGGGRCWRAAGDMRYHAECRVISLKVPDASVTTKTSNPSSMAESAGNATQTSVTTPAIINCFLPVALTAFTLSQPAQRAFICTGGPLLP